MSYCQYCLKPDAKKVHVDYHDKEYGFPITKNQLFFERLILEINQAGLSWETILNKKDNFKKAYDNFDINKIANYKEKDKNRLLADAGIIRNKLKVAAAVYNAQQFLEIIKENGNFINWLDKHHPLNSEQWTVLFKKTFKFVGGEIVNEFLMSTGYLPGAHEQSCTIFDVIKKKNPKWSEK